MDGVSNNPLFAILIPHFNQQRELEAVIQSCAEAAQSEQAHLVVVDDGSKDSAATATLMDKVESWEAFSRVTTVTSRKNQGVSKSLNLGLNMVTEAFFFRVDADDRVLPDRFERQLEMLVRGADLVFGNALVVYEGERIASTRSLPLRQMIQALPFQNLFLHPTLAARTSFFLERGGYPELTRSGQDWAFWKSHMHEASVEMIEEPLVKLGFRLDSVSNSKFSHSESRIHTIKLRTALRYFDEESALRHARDLGWLYYCAVRLLPNPYLLRFRVRLARSVLKGFFV